MLGDYVKTKCAECGQMVTADGFRNYQNCLEYRLSVANTRIEELERFVEDPVDWFAADWNAYALADDDTLTADALALKRRLLKITGIGELRTEIKRLNGLLGITLRGKKKTLKGESNG
jgi:hypothetical protein